MQQLWTGSLQFHSTKKHAQATFLNWISPNVNIFLSTSINIETEIHKVLMYVCVCYIMSHVTPLVLSSTSKTVLFYMSENVTHDFLCFCTHDWHAYSNLILKTINKPSKLSLCHLFNTALFELQKFNTPPRVLVNGLTGHISHLIYCLHSSK